MEREDEDFGEGYIAESHPLRPTHLTVPLGGRSDSRAPSISSSVSDLDVPIYTRETTVPLSARKVKLSSRYVYRTSDFMLRKLNTHENKFVRTDISFNWRDSKIRGLLFISKDVAAMIARTCAVNRDDTNDCHLKCVHMGSSELVGARQTTTDDAL
ncbi:hypothetical protein ALC56_01562 [Trachymyrmex septentrionalis]|uniref:Uncharacterized protein n=1 Tax=Trachymyrmex septentrionalis TaxID=34720 RepID=A0A195FW05_9HYME|nr:hypothetical protein ALC56_01562 [Trachymyrmex septentrionalis]